MSLGDSYDVARPKYHGPDAPLVSVCISSYNYARFISDAIDSALAQEYQPIEVIVCDNGSTDDTFEVLSRYADDPRVRVFRNESNLGIAINTNLTVERASGEYIVILSADDFLYPSHVRRSMTRLLDQVDPVDIVHSGAILVDPVGEPIGVRTITGALGANYSRRNEFAPSLLTCCVCLPTMIVPKKIYEELGCTDPQFTVATDWDIILRFLAAGKRFAYIAEPMIAVRMHDNQSSNFRDYYATGKALNDYLMILERHLTDTNSWRFAGYESRIKGAISSHVAPVRTMDGYIGDSSYEARIEKISNDLDEWATRRNEAARPEVPRVSVILPTSGNLSLLKNAMMCLAEQTFTSWEVIVVQSSGQHCAAWLRSFPIAEKIRYVRPDSQLTVAAARNFGLQLARGEYLTYLDDDNVISPDHFQSLVATLDASRADAALSAAHVVIDYSGDEGSAQRKPQVRMTDVFRRHADVRSSYIANALPLNAVMHRMAVIDRIGPFCDHLTVLEDWEFMLRLERTAPLAFTDAATLEVHNMLHFKGQQIAQCGPTMYLAVIDAIYAAYPAPSAELQESRVRYRAELQSIFGDFSARSATLEGMMDMLHRLAGRHLTFTDSLTGDDRFVVEAAL